MRYSVEEIRRIVAVLAAQYGADRVYLFGTYARGDAKGNGKRQGHYAHNHSGHEIGHKCFLVVVSQCGNQLGFKRKCVHNYLKNIYKGIKKL